MFLYHLNEFRKAASLPTHQWAEANDLFLQWTGSNSPISAAIKASNEMVKRATLEGMHPTFGIKKVDVVVGGQKTTAKIKEKVLLKKPFCTLRHFTKQLNDNLSLAQPKMLIVAPLSGHFSTLLRDTVRTCLQDFDVTITDWTDARLVPLQNGDFTLDNYVDYLLDFFQCLGSDVHVLAVCQPVVPVMMATSLLAQRNQPTPASIILMGGPVDTRINPGQVNAFATTHSIEWFKRNIINTIPSYYPGAKRRVCPGFIMLNGFMLLNIDKHQDLSWKLFQNLIKGDEDKIEKHIKFYDEYRAVMDIPATYFLNSMQHVFQEFSLPLGKMTWRGKVIDLAAIEKTKLFTIEGELDDISPPGQTEAAHDLCHNIPKKHKRHYLQKEAGHYGIFNGSRWRENIYPRIVDFCLAKR
jgi:poly(3-hydroxybutyrate) depolymerase